MAILIAALWPLPAAHYLKKIKMIIIVTRFITGTKLAIAIEITSSDLSYYCDMNIFSIISENYDAPAKGSQSPVDRKPDLNAELNALLLADPPPMDAASLGLGCIPIARPCAKPKPE